MVLVAEVFAVPANAEMACHIEVRSTESEEGGGWLTAAPRVGLARVHTTKGNIRSIRSLLALALHRSSPAYEWQKLVQHLLEPGESLGGRHPHSSANLAPAGVGVTPAEACRRVMPVSHRHQLEKSTREQRRRRGRARVLQPV